MAEAMKPGEIVVGVAELRAPSATARVIVDADREPPVCVVLTTVCEGGDPPIVTLGEVVS